MASDKEHKSVIAAVVDYFIHPSLRIESDRLYRVRILIGVLVTFTAVVVAAALIVLLARFPLKSILFGGGLCMLAMITFISLLLKLRRKGSYLFCSIVAVLVTFITISLGICVSGGPANSPVAQLLVVPLLMAYFFGGIRWGSYTVAMSFMAFFLFIVLYLLGVSFLQTIDSTGQMAITQFLVSFVNLCVISGMAFIYEYTAASLKRERDQEHEKYIRLAKTDPLTGLANRRNFDAMLAERIAMYGALNPPRRFALGYLDLDEFKPINDRYGHAVGDEVLRAVSERLRAALRGSDFVGRHGGDEFMLMLDSILDEGALEAMAQRLSNSIAQPISTSAGVVNVGGSLGFAMFPMDAYEIEVLKKAADTAMYEAKRNHSGWCFYRPELKQ